MNSRFHIRKFMSIAILFALLSVLGASVPNTAHAATTPFTIESCNSGLGLNYEAWQYTSMVVGCLKTTVMSITLHPTNGFLYKISEYMSLLVAIMAMFAIIVFGMRIMGGEPQLKQKAVGFMLRLGLVFMFSYNLGGIGQQVFDTMDSMICMVNIGEQSASNSRQMAMPGILPTTYAPIRTFDYLNDDQCYPWNFIDKFIGRLFGFGEHVLLTNGLLGIVSSALFSSTVGMLVFLTGFSAMLDILFMVLRVIFMYLTCVLSVAFMIIISPLIIPMALFYSQERYFKKWLDILLTGIFVPVFLFAFLSMFLGIYELLIDRLVNILGGVDAQGKTHFDAYWRLNQPKFSWLMPSDPNLARDFEAFTNSDKVGSPAVQSWINPYARRAIDTNLFVAPGVDFGEAGVKVAQQLVLGFISLWIFSSLMKSMIKMIPEVVKSITGAGLEVGYRALSMEAGIKRGVNEMGDAARTNPFNASGIGNRNRR